WNRPRGRSSPRRPSPGPSRWYPPPSRERTAHADRGGEALRARACGSCSSLPGGPPGKPFAIFIGGVRTVEDPGVVEDRPGDLDPQASKDRAKGALGVEV